MKLYGFGALCFPASGVVAHDFEDGPFETDDPKLIDYALSQGCTKKPPEDAHEEKPPKPAKGKG